MRSGETNNKGSKRSGIFNLLWVLLGLVIGLGLLILVGWQLTQVQPTNKTNKTNSYTIEKKSDTQNSILSHPEEEIILAVKSKDGKSVPDGAVKWWYNSNFLDFNLISFTETEDDTLTLKVISTEVITEPSVIDITAIIESDGVQENTSVKIHVGDEEYVPIDLEDEFFVLGESVPGSGEKDTLLGFNSETLADFENLDEYNTLDFSNQEEIKYVSGECEFPPEIFEEWKVKKIDFGNLEFLNNDEGQTGFELFKDCQLDELTVLNLADTIWADEETKESAASTFEGANLPSLEEINLSNAVFACEGMTTDGTSVRTALNTFANANLSNLTELNLNGVKFADTEMTTGGHIYTADNTFHGAQLDNLESLDLTNVYFSSSNMTTAGNVYTGYNTFNDANLTSLTELILTKDLQHAVFASSNMSSTGNIHTGNRTFYLANMSSIAKNEITGTGIFGVSNMTSIDASFVTKDETYEQTLFKFAYNPVPLTNQYFEFSEQEITKDGTECNVPTIIGFSNDVEQGVIKLDEFNTLDFSENNQNIDTPYEYM